MSNNAFNSFFDHLNPSSVIAWVKCLGTCKNCVQTGARAGFGARAQGQDLVPMFRHCAQTLGQTLMKSQVDTGACQIQYPS